MRIIKHGHACVTLTTSSVSVVIDPGMFTEPATAAGADAVLITHEHPDHWSVEQLAATDAPIWTIASVADQLAAADPGLRARITVVAPGERFVVAGLPVTAVGDEHAVIHPELPRAANSGYLLEAEGHTVFHPGDALSVPPTTPDLLLLPVSAPWLKVSECIDYARDVGAPLSLAIHDAVYSQAGLGIVDGHLGRFLAPSGQEYTRLPAGEELAM
jgi:L-ascorbate metabolism protein UlaG (beta-lactamase superfamily)